MNGKNRRTKANRLPGKSCFPSCVRPSVSLLLLLVALWPWALSGQADSVRLTHRFSFAGGVYRSFEAAQVNQPDHSWEELDATLAINPNTLIARVERISLRGSQARMPLDSLWGFSRDGVLFRRVTELPPQRDAILFAGLWELGSISLYSYEKDTTRLIEIKAYNPVTGRPFRSGRVPRTEKVELVRMVDFRTGQTLALTRENLLALIRTDEPLLTQIAAMPDDEVDLVRTVQAFNDRNPVYVKESGNRK